MRQSGQTLIETIVAIFILTTALTAGLALTIYILSHTDQTLHEIVATNLAREGIDVVKNMRDTNWLESDAKGAGWTLTDCTLGSKTFPCYPKAWEGVPKSGNNFHAYDLSVAGGYVTTNYRAEFDNNANTWNLSQNPGSYALYKQVDGSYTHSPAAGGSIYARKIILSHNSTTPAGVFGVGGLSELVVTSIVGWTARGCTVMTGTPADPSTTNCNVTVTERFTNWKDYR